MRMLDQISICRWKLHRGENKTNSNINTKNHLITIVIIIRGQLMIL